MKKKKMRGRQGEGTQRTESKDKQDKRLGE